MDEQVLSHQWKADKPQLDIGICGNALVSVAFAGTTTVLSVGGSFATLQATSEPCPQIYNVERAQWEDLPQLIQPRKCCAAVAINGKVFIFGGIPLRCPALALNSIEMLDLHTIHAGWQRVGTMQQRRLGCAGSSIQRDEALIVICGGKDENSRALNSFEVFSSTNYSSQILPLVKLSQPRYGHSLVVLGGGRTFVCAGGRKNDFFYANMEVVEMKINNAEGRVFLEGGSGATTRIIPLPSCKVRRFKAVGLDETHSVFIVGGCDHEYPNVASWRYSLVHNTWHQGPKLNVPRAFFGITVANSTVWVVGGFGGRFNYQKLQSVETLQFQSSSVKNNATEKILRNCNNFQHQWTILSNYLSKLSAEGYDSTVYAYLRSSSVAKSAFQSNVRLKSNDEADVEE